MKIVVSDICSALESNTIGSKVTDHANFLETLREAINNHDTSGDRAPGQHFIVLPPQATDWVSCGIGKATKSAQDYHLLEYRGNVTKFLKREHAAQTDSVACVVYTNEAYLADPDITDDRRKMVEEANADYWLVAVLATCEEAGAPQLGPFRFVHNLAGGNNAFDLPTVVERRWQEQASEADEQTVQLSQTIEIWEQEFAKLVEEAKKVKLYNETWTTVADLVE